MSVDSTYEIRLVWNPRASPIVLSRHDGSVDDSDGGSEDETDEMDILVGSKTYTEQINLGYVAYELLDANTDHHIIDQTEYGGNAALAEAYQQDDPNIHVLYDYLSSLWMAHSPLNDEEISDPDELHRRLTEQMEAEHPVQILDRADWENSWALYAEEGTLEDVGVWTISDLAAYVNAGNYDLRLAMEEDFRDRPGGLNALLDHYGFEDEAVEAWEDDGGFVDVVSGPATASAITEGKADIGVGYSTSGWMTDVGNVALLEDDQLFWPSYHPVGLVHDDVATEEVIAELNKMPGAIPDAATMRTLYQRASESDLQEVVRSHLRENGFIE